LPLWQQLAKRGQESPTRGPCGLGGLGDNLDAVRHIGNFAAHPTKSVNTGEIIDVEPGEAEWNLDVVEALMDVLYVQPAKLALKKAALNAKLTEPGKKPIP
jgi:Domain of unknown function (DUF4145)